MLHGRKILIIVGGGISAYKAPDIIRLLRKAGAEVWVVLTKSGAEFVTPLTLASLSGNKVYNDLFSLTDEIEMGHISLSRMADLIVVAPATADLLSKFAHGLANDLASTIFLASNKQIMVAPAMNVQMWHKPANRRNIAQLQQDGVIFIGPKEGEMACGEFGLGRMAEPIEIIAAIQAFFNEGGIPMPPPNQLHELAAPNEYDNIENSKILHGKHVLITAGPTHEPIDPIRYIANRSSGKQGYALVEAAKKLGARVTLVSGPVTLAPPNGVNVVNIHTAKDMLEAVNFALPADIAIFTAAVGDWRVHEEFSQKIKKNDMGIPALNLIENPDILNLISNHQTMRPKVVVGFAAETEHVLLHAREKILKKGCDFIVANDVSASSGVMGGGL